MSLVGEKVISTGTQLATPKFTISTFISSQSAERSVGHPKPVNILPGIGKLQLIPPKMAIFVVGLLIQPPEKFVLGLYI